MRDNTSHLIVSGSLPLDGHSLRLRVVKCHEFILLQFANSVKWT